MPNYPSSFTSGAAPGLRSVNNVTDRRDFKYFLQPSAASSAGFAISIATFVALPNVSAVGNSLTYAVAGTGGVALTIDGQSADLVSGTSTILVKNQASAIQNGIYTITNKGATGTSWVLTRDTRFNEDAELKYNTIFSVAAGTTNGSTKWFISSAEPMVVGTDSISFTALPTSVDYPSSANYPTDVNVGIGDTNSKSSDFVADFRSMINQTQKDLSDLETEINSLDTTVGIKYLGVSNIYTMQFIYRRLEKLNFQIKKLKDDIDLMNNTGYFGETGTFPSIGVTGAYPSSLNRITNVAGGF